jgi:hypothetical protein
MPNNLKKTANVSLEMKPLLEPGSDLTSPAGFAAPPSIHSARRQVEQSVLSNTAARVVQDPLLLRKLSDRVYELMLEDLRYQQQRSRNYGSRLNG